LNAERYWCINSVRLSVRSYVTRRYCHNG